MKTENRFALVNLEFAEIKVIRDACQELGKQGSERAKAIAATLEKELGEVEI